MILSLERWLALTPSVASLQALTSRSSVRFRGVAPHHRSPTSAMEPAGQDLGAINGQYRSNGARMPVLSGQSCCSRSATFDRRIAAGESLARDRFDSDCVLGTQLESSQPHHALRRSQIFPGCLQVAPAELLARVCLCNAVRRSFGPVSAFASAHNVASRHELVSPTSPIRVRLRNTWISARANQ